MKRRERETRDPEPLARSRWLEWWRHGVRLPNGHEAELDVVHHPGAAAVVPFVSPDEVVLIRQYRFAADDGELVEVPAGKLDPGESPERCAARELEEEAGLRPARLVALGPIWPSPGFTDEVIHLFAGLECESVPPRLEQDEVIETLHVPYREALTWALEGRISDAKSALALIRAGHHLRRTARP